MVKELQTGVSIRGGTRLGGSEGGDASDGSKLIGVPINFRHPQALEMRD